jgi:hypothetical protein
MSPLRLTDEQLTAIMKLARPLQPQCRTAFMEILSHILRGRADVGDGELHRVCRQIIRDNHLFEAPADLAGGRWSKHR